MSMFFRHFWNNLSVTNFQTPIEEDLEFGDNNNCLVIGFMRKSMSMNDNNKMREDLVINEVTHSSSRYHPHRRPTKTQPQESSKAKFGSMAEAIYHSHRDTPARFHSPRPQGFTGRRAKLARPQSPNLRSKARSGPLHVITEQEKEVMELEEIKKHQIKALPLPKSVLYGPIHLPDVIKKPVTKPEPFNLTEVQKKMKFKKDESKSPEPVFKASPAPKHILEKPHVPVKPILPKTLPASPKFHNKKADSQNVDKNKPEPQQKPAEKPQRNGPVHLKLFPFEDADF